MERGKVGLLGGRRFRWDQDAEARHLARRLRLGGERRHEKTKGEGDDEPDGAARHGRLRHAQMCREAFYPPCAEEGNQFLSLKSFKSVENVCGYTTSL